MKSNHAQNAARGINNGLGVLQVVQNLDAALDGRNARAQRVQVFKIVVAVVGHLHVQVADFVI